MYDAVQAREFTVARNAIGAAIAGLSAGLGADPDPGVVAAKRALGMARRGLGVLDRGDVRRHLAAGHRAWAEGTDAVAVGELGLGREQVAEVFCRDIRPRLDGPARERPTAVFVGGQTAAGKTSIQQVVLRDLGLVDVVPLDGDDLLDDHPAYRDAVRADDRTAAALLGEHTSAWWTMTVEHLRAGRVDTVISAPLGGAPWALDRFRDFHEAGYRVEVVLLAVPPAQSLLSLLERWHRDRQPERHGFGRWVAPETHDRFVTGILETADAVDASDTVDACHVARRGQGVVYSNERVGRGRSTREVIEAERARRWSDAERADFEALTAHLTDSAEQDSRPLPADLRPLLADIVERGRD